MSEWLLGTGYISLWKRLHRVEEGILVAAPLERVIAEARADVHRTTGSTMLNREALVLEAQIAIEVLAKRAQLIVMPPPVVPALPLAPPDLSDEQFARETLRQFRRAINEFRDDARLGLVRARNQLLRTVFVTTLVGYGLLALSMLAGAPPRAIMAAGCFFLIGAIVGLFNRLYLDASAQTAVEDYGLAAARLLHTPIISGLAAVGAVMIIPMLSVLVGDGTSQGQDTGIMPKLLDIFDIDKRPFGLVLAAVFGLSPVALITRLQQESEQYKTGLKSSETQTR